MTMIRHNSFFKLYSRDTYWWSLS